MKKLFILFILSALVFGCGHNQSEQNKTQIQKNGNGNTYELDKETDEITGIKGNESVSLDVSKSSTFTSEEERFFEKVKFIN